MAFVDENKEIKSRLPIPKFTGDTFLTFKRAPNENFKIPKAPNENFKIPKAPNENFKIPKAPNENFKRAKKLLFVAKSLHNKDSSKEKKPKEDSLNDRSEKEHLPKEKFSISEKLTEIYLESAKKNTARNGCFIKCNYLEELIVQEDLSYFIMKMYPSKLFLYYKNPYRVQFFYHAKIEEEYDLFNSIDNEEIPEFIFDQIMSCENWNLMYDYHCFLQIQKYAYEDEHAQPVFSGFVLLKPTTKLLIDLINKSANDTNCNNGSSQEEFKESYESNICVEISGPLYLDVHPAALELINLLKIYQSPFGFSSLKSALSKRPVSVNKQSVKINPFEEELLKMVEEKIPPQSSSSEEKDFDLLGSPFNYVDLKEQLHSSLVKRNIEICEALYTSQTTTLVEVFELISSKMAITTDGCRRLEDSVKYLSVFWKSGHFYSCLTLDKYVYDAYDHNDFIPLIGEREDLDRYILKVAEILSSKFTQYLTIRYKNLIDNTDKHFFPRIIDTKIHYERDERNFMKPRISGTKRKAAAVMKERYCMDETDSESENELDFLEKHGLIVEKDYAVKCKCAHQKEHAQKVLSSDKEVSDDKEEAMDLDLDVDICITDILNSSQFSDIFSSKIESQETHGVQSDPVISTFRSQRFEEGKSIDEDSTTEINNDSAEFYPRLKSKFEISKEDFMRDIIHDHSDDMKKLLKLIQGCDD